MTPAIRVWHGRWRRRVPSPARPAARVSNGGLWAMRSQMRATYLCACLVRAHRLAIPMAKSMTKNHAATK
jgi:hypothetical protein